MKTSKTAKWLTVLILTLIVNITNAQNNDYERLKEKIKKDFNAWLIKGEFESNSDYELRIKNQAATKFNSITLEKIENCITYKQYALYQHKLEDVQQPIDNIPNPSQSDINKHESINYESLDKLIFKYFIGEFSPEYMLLITRNNDNLMEIFKSPNFSWARNKLLKLIKYRP